MNLPGWANVNFIIQLSIKRGDQAQPISASRSSRRSRIPDHSANVESFLVVSGIVPVLTCPRGRGGCEKWKGGHRSAALSRWNCESTISSLVDQVCWLEHFRPRLFSIESLWIYRTYEKVTTRYSICSTTPGSHASFTSSSDIIPR